MGCGSKPVSSEPYQTYTYPEQFVPQENPLPEMTENEEQPVDMTSYTTVQQQPYMNQQMMPFTKSYTTIPGTNCMNRCSVRPNYQARPICRPVCNRRPLCRTNPNPVQQVDYNYQAQTLYCNPQPSRCITSTCGWGGSGYNQGGDSWSSGDSWSNGDSWSTGGSGYNPGSDSWTSGGSGYNPGGDVVNGGSGYNPGWDNIYSGNEGFNPGYTSQQPIYNQAPVYSAPSFYPLQKNPSSGCGSSMGCGNNMMPQPMQMTRPCGSGGCSSPPIYQAGNAVTLPARMPAPVSAAQPAAPGMPPPAEIDAADSSADESSSDAAE